MKRAFFAGVFAIFIGIPFLNAQYAQVRVGILPFFESGKGAKQDPVSPQIIAELTQGLSRYKFIQLLERAQINKLLKEIQFSQTGLMDENTAARAGKLQGIQLMVTGTLSKGVILAKVIHVESGRILAAISANGLPGLSKLADDLAENMETYMARENLRSLRNDSPAINLDFWVERVTGSNRQRLPDAKGKLRIGEKVIFNFQANEDGFITIVDIQPGGDVVILFPNDFSGTNQIQANKLYSIPSLKDAFDIVVSEPAGMDTVVAFFTRKKVQWLDRKKLEGQGFWTVKKKEKLAMSRGFRVVSTSLGRDEWESRPLEIEVVR